MVEFNISNTDSVKFPRITKRFQNVIRNLLHYGIVLQYRHIGEQLIPSSDNDIFTLTDPSPIGVGSMGVVLRGKYQNKNIVIKIINGNRSVPLTIIGDLPPNAPVINILGYSSYYADENKYEFILNCKDNTIVIFMEELTGGSLNDVIIKCKKNPNLLQQYGGLDNLVATIGIRIAGVFDAIHKYKNCMYSDINVSNILFNSNNEPILIDFDSFRTQSISHNMAFGTLGYIPLCKYTSIKYKCVGQTASDDYEMLVITLLDVSMLNEKGLHNTPKNRRQLLVIHPGDSNIVRDLKTFLLRLQIRDRIIESKSEFADIFKQLLLPYLNSNIDKQITYMNPKRRSIRRNKR